MQISGNFSEVIERLHKLLIGFDKTFALCFRKRPDRLSIQSAFKTWVAFKIVRIEFYGTDAKWK